MMSGSSSAPIAEREYVWGPDYVDECVAQFDQNNVVYYVLQDANYDVVALLNSNGQPTIQYTYEPYGPLQLAESFAQQPVNRLAHQGLFFERFDAGPYDPALVPGAKGLCYTRGRWYDPLTGRPTSRDPNETALPVVTALATNGQTVDIVFGAFDVLGHYGDGMNLHTHVGANPVNATDPSGLAEWDLLVTRDWDDIWDSIVGNGEAYLGVQGAATWGASWGGNVAALPRMSGHLMGVSEGFSDYADFYAQQVEFLPVDAGIQGLGAFNSLRYVSTTEDAGRFGAATAAAGAIRRGKGVNLPSWRRIIINMGHILSGHVVEGARAVQAGAKKTFFPGTMSPRQIENAVREAYRYAKLLKRQGERVLVEGTGHGLRIRMWVNIAAEEIESAWPIL
jgi:hypothetical protein